MRSPSEPVSPRDQRLTRHACIGWAALEPGRGLLGRARALRLCRRAVPGLCVAGSAKGRLGRPYGSDRNRPELSLERVETSEEMTWRARTARVVVFTR